MWVNYTRDDSAILAYYWYNDASDVAVLSSNRKVVLQPPENTRPYQVSEAGHKRRVRVIID